MSRLGPYIGLVHITTHMSIVTRGLMYIAGGVIFAATGLRLFTILALRYFLYSSVEDS